MRIRATRRTAPAVAVNAMVCVSNGRRRECSSSIRTEPSDARTWEPRAAIRLRRLALLSDPMRIVFRNPDMPTAMAGHRIVRSGFLWRFEHHHGQRRSDFRGPVFVQKHRESRRLLCLAVRRGREASRTVGLGCVANVAGIAYGKQARWNTNGR